MDFFIKSTVYPLGTLLLIYLLYSVFRFVWESWWTPIQIQNVMRSRGIKGPPYEFYYGNTKEILSMRKESFRKPMEDLSHHIFPRIQPHMYSWIKRYGKSFLYWSGRRAQLATSDLEYVNEIMNNKDNAYPKDDMLGYMKKLVGNGLLTSEGEKWAQRRKLANHAFHGQNLKNMVPAMVASVEEMLERWKQHEGREIEVQDEFRILTSDIISRTAFGSSYAEGKKIFAMMRKLTLLTARNLSKIRLPSSWFYRSADDIESEKLEQEIRESIMEIIKKRLKKADGKADCYGNDFLGLLLKCSHDENSNNKVSTDDIIDECKTFYLAGYESTTSLLAWSILLLAIHIDWQENMRNEVIKLFGHHTPDSDGISKMKTAKMIINESLRLYPPVLLLVRKVKQDVRLGEVTLPGNTRVNIPTLALHRDTQVWGEDAHLFKPERFSEGVAKATNNNPAAFIPFGFGPRNCVGMNFATNEAKVALSMILQRYTFSLSSNYVHSPIMDLNIIPQYGVKILLHPLKT